MKVLVNASTLVVGGGIHIGVSFIEEAMKRKDFQWKFVVSKGIYDNLSIEITKDSRIHCNIISPSKIFSGRKIRKQIKNIEKQFQPDLVYSLGFPSYINFDAKELGRYTNPWEINPEPLPWHTIKGIKKKILIKLGIWYRLYWSRRASYIETQTLAAAKGISKRSLFPFDKIKVIPNSPNYRFVLAGNNLDYKNFYFEKENFIFCLAAGYRHKNLDIIPEVASILKNKFDLNYSFLLTLDFESDIWKEIELESNRLNVSNLVVNLGPLKLLDCINYYEKAKIVFLPTLLEVFSATYIEAMVMKVPIVTSDLEFAYDNCKDAAIYFKHGEALSAATKIHELVTDKELYEVKIQKGIKVLASYPNLENKYNDLFNWFKKIK